MDQSNVAPSTPEPSPKGVPPRTRLAPTRRGEARRKLFLQVASEVFLDQGYAATTLDMVIKRSGGSRQTLYALFGSKEGLFEAIIADLCEGVFGPMEASNRLDEPPERMLQDFGTRLLGVLLAPLGIALFRTIVAESTRAPELAQTLWRLGPERDHALLTRYFIHQREKGALVVDDPSAAAQHFVAGLSGFVHVCGLLGIGAPMDAAAIRRHVAEVVRHFLAGYGARAAAAT